MMAKKRNKYYRGWFIGGGVLILVTMITALANLWVYFNSGADRSTALNIPPVLPEVHVPDVHWLPDENPEGRKMEDFNRQLIMKDYIRGWYQLHLSYLSGEPIGLREYFTPSVLHHAMRAIYTAGKNLQLHQTDLQHNILLHFYSADGQIVSFTDKQLILKQRLYRRDNGEKIFSGEITADYAVVMLLDDGYWRIKNIVRKEASSVPSIDTIKPNKQGLVTARGNRFFQHDTVFVPKGINYYPQKTPWLLFWPNFDSAIIKKDLQRVKSLGFNCTRIFINFSDFNKGNVPHERMMQLQSLLDMSERLQLKVIVTLFDFVGDYRVLNLTATDRQLETLLTHFNRHPALLAWDLKNEPDLDFKHHDPGDVQEWLGWTLKRARIYDPNHLFTIGWAYPENAHLFSDKLDFVSFHSYRTVQQLSTGIDLLQAHVKNKPLVLGEFGLSTYHGLWSPRGTDEEEQADYFAQVKKVLRQKGNIPFFVWTLYDFSEVPTDVTGRMPWRRNPQKNFGLITVEGKVKKGAGVLSEP